MRRVAHSSGCARCGATAGCSAMKYQSLSRAAERLSRSSVAATAQNLYRGTRLTCRATIDQTTSINGPATSSPVSHRFGLVNTTRPQVNAVRVWCTFLTGYRCFTSLRCYTGFMCFTGFRCFTSFRCFTGFRCLPVSGVSPVSTFGVKSISQPE